MSRRDFRAYALILTACLVTFAGLAAFGFLNAP